MAWEDLRDAQFPSLGSQVERRQSVRSILSVTGLVGRKCPGPRRYAAVVIPAAFWKPARCSSSGRRSWMPHVRCGDDGLSRAGQAPLHCLPPSAAFQVVLHRSLRSVFTYCIAICAQPRGMTVS